MTRAPRFCLSWVLVAHAAACAHRSAEPDFSQLGRTDASSEPLGAEPLAPADLSGITSRGGELFAMARAQAVALEHARAKVGIGVGDRVLPLVQVDPGLRSAQVMLLRWPAGVSRELKLAQRWLSLSVVLEPARVLTHQPLTGPVEPGTLEYAHAAGLLAAEGALRDARPQHAFELLPVAERVPATKPGRPPTEQLRVYLLAQAEGPDGHMCVTFTKKGRVKQVAAPVWSAAAGDEPVLRVRGPAPSPESVARARLRGGDSLRVESTAGAWLIDASTGKISRP